MAERNRNVFLLLQNELLHQNKSDSVDEEHAVSSEEEYKPLDDLDSEAELVVEDSRPRIEEEEVDSDDETKL